MDNITGLYHILFIKPMPQTQILQNQQLIEKARALRCDILRMIHAAASGHPGGSLSAIDLMVGLYYKVMKHDPMKPTWPDRDRFILSKGHGSPALYAILIDLGYHPKSELLNFRKLESPLQGHPDMRRLAGIEASTGSLGQGLSIGIGVALSGKLDKKNYRTYVMIGDGECNEGQIWESAMYAGFHKLSNLTCILDYNKFQLDGSTRDILCMEPMSEKWQSFGWAVKQINGHDMGQILEAYEWIKTVKDQPTLILAHTVKGKGVSFMENNNAFHGVAPNDEELKKALAELGGKV